MPYLTVPQHEAHEKVPEDFLVLLGVAAVWRHPGFRAEMKRIMRDEEEKGNLPDILHTRDGRPH